MGVPVNSNREMVLNIKGPFAWRVFEGRGGEGRRDF